MQEVTSFCGYMWRRVLAGNGRTGVAGSKPPASSSVPPRHCFGGGENNQYLSDMCPPYSVCVYVLVTVCVCRDFPPLIQLRGAFYICVYHVYIYIYEKVLLIVLQVNVASLLEYLQMNHLRDVLSR